MAVVRLLRLCPLVLVFVAMLGTWPPRSSAWESYEYDQAGRLLRVQFDDGREIVYTYDAAGSLVSAGMGEERPLFHRGDPNADNALDLTDGIFLFTFLFLGGPAPTCREAADTNNDAIINISDGIFLLNFLFLGTAPPPAPGPPGSDCGPDTDAEGSAGDLGCELYKNC